MKISFSTAKPNTVPCDALIVFVSKDDWQQEIAPLNTAMGGGLIDWMNSADFSSSAVSVPTFGRIAANNLLIVPTNAEGFAKAIAKAGATARSRQFASIALSGVSSASIGAAIEHLGNGAYAYQPYLREDDRTPLLSDVTFLGIEETPEAIATAKAAKIRAQWQDWARDLVNGPPADLYPATLASKSVEALGSLDNVTVKIIDIDKCEAQGMVGLVAVGQGSAKPGCMIHVSYHPPGAEKHIAFVGKGVTFDSGGLSLKPSGAMQTMRCDMGGAATVLGALGVIAELKTNLKVDCFVAAVENMNDGNSYKLGDILRYRNGVTVEIHNTDAEGRLVLADALICACETEGVTTVIDAATLTGACVVALGEDFTAAFTHDDGLAAELQSACDASGDGLWRLPLHDAYKEKLKGKWSQIKNVGGRDAGATTAALFLQYFVTDDVRWCHLDVAGSSWRDSAGKGWAAGGTGQMVRGLANWAAEL